jgi:hypothetical protein
MTAQLAAFLPISTFSSARRLIPLITGYLDTPIGDGPATPSKLAFIHQRSKPLFRSLTASEYIIAQDSTLDMDFFV